MERYRIIEKPNPRDAEILWEDYFNHRIQYNIKDEDLRVKASVVICKKDKEFEVFLEFNTENTDFEIEITIFDDKGKKVDSGTRNNWRSIKGFFVEKLILEYRVLSRIDKVIVSQVK